MKKYILIIICFYFLTSAAPLMFYINSKDFIDVADDSLIISSAAVVNEINDAKEDDVLEEIKVSTYGLDTSEKNWWYRVMPEGVPSGSPDDYILNKYDSVYYLGDTSERDIYLTFDEGYENGYSNKILDILRENQVTAAFFVTSDFIRENPDLIIRMVNEGHVVGNHSDTHPSMAEVALNVEGSVESEIAKCAIAFKEVTGKDIDKFFRPPYGKYSELSIAKTHNLGYKTIFWSFAYADWDVNEQPDLNYAFNIMNSQTHPGGIYLLHAVSKTNTEVLDQQIKIWKDKGYTFKSLYDLN